MMSQILNTMSHFILDRAMTEATINLYVCRSSFYWKHDEGFTITISTVLDSFPFQVLWR